MRSDAATVDDYLARLDPDRRERLEVIRRLCRETLRDHEEAMEYGMPVYRRDGRAEFAWASQARHIAVYVMKEDVVAANSERLAGQDMGKGCLRLKPSADIDEDLLRALLTDTAASSEPPW